jgi:hypothetical protein
LAQSKDRLKSYKYKGVMVGCGSVETCHPDWGDPNNLPCKVEPSLGKRPFILLELHTGFVGSIEDWSENLGLLPVTRARDRVTLG